MTGLGRLLLLSFLPIRYIRSRSLCVSSRSNFSLKISRAISSVFSWFSLVVPWIRRQFRLECCSCRSTCLVIPYVFHNYHFFISESSQGLKLGLTLTFLIGARNMIAEVQHNKYYQFSFTYFDQHYSKTKKREEWEGVRLPDTENFHETDIQKTKKIVGKYMHTLHYFKLMEYRIIYCHYFSFILLK